MASLDAPSGSYAVDTFARWQDNARGIAKSLDALRLVDGDGTTKHGEQYRGRGDRGAGWVRHDFSGAPARALRRAQRDTHPDTGGDAATFERVLVAEAKLREAGLL
ncbi:hypothetical protein [Microbacterium saperdae]|uniref:J domain-containing protein n=1 Tax=Microbacterium saperdae TaxID=69368 RepID=A0A543BQX8_9MICO|nr:hypothetical protein [Microbacterium saperdae]TQL87231.1 hypothetical protein FB560_2898 [Microbacterium saperdae]GGM41930.1 hypothetical protein GCM10010489_11180 [Microbacterium saperdae]